VDVVMQVQKIVSDSHHKSPNDSTPLPTLAPSSNDDAVGNGAGGRLDDRTVFTYALQVLNDNYHSNEMNSKEVVFFVIILYVGSIA